MQNTEPNQAFLVLSLNLLGFFDQPAGPGIIFFIYTSVNSLRSGDAYKRQ